MMFCRGRGLAGGKCQWREVCSRYVLGRAVTPTMDVSAEWIDSCRNAKRFVRVGGGEGAEAPESRQGRVSVVGAINSTSGAENTLKTPEIRFGGKI